jgi:hypothetical protein
MGTNNYLPIFSLPLLFLSGIGKMCVVLFIYFSHFSLPNPYMYVQCTTEGSNMAKYISQRKERGEAEDAYSVEGSDFQTIEALTSAI